MAINYTDIKKLAELARIQLNDATIAETTQSIADVLSLVNRLNAIDTKNIDPMAHPTDAIQCLRSDNVTEVNQREAFQVIAPCAKNGLYLVPKVID
ncbi:MAG: Asp-tRNA(Asn)/Glu-tRNA(Gln) amidotransferase subunit GatC [Porticoccus sp.]|nr:Asp-tRNA(Asn)/Glu-tRNA(Gln) amidotransferase subunit GatC [Porticoccus sp.]MDO7653338.1 Asp-tRNA(Asn)/Glu-tRNA(Gln) amidotransferase subunit GatC [Porticoccus sp.]|tara:strand:- start:4505 stop:4792 length:288 start_codon:yes stop_codon:yes gene_type:complete